ncbi:hypothetical protein J14TS2_35370 [Bacillus sp. J14TS2]|uniref:hypothetical protein n=1 Tax=Bacillus sp. J14TS2 TaxID=2807188 RepID=UPI001B13FD72|nr:hypothetical protein [Bacillus sp. J14TS2]GIN73062.1 hypothetical protein J14TS2_35370 [Bacillus sp. J14TS2]
MSKEILHEWQPESFLDFSLEEKRLYTIGLVDVNIGANELNITLDNGTQDLEIIYNQIDFSIPVEYYVWSFRYGTEGIRNDLAYANCKVAANINKDYYYAFKMENSEYIQWHDRISPFTSKDYPKLEHRIYITSDDVLEVLSTFEPTFRIKTIS